jgi:phage replication O-like protein O
MVMALPQKEHGYTAIANEVVEKLARFRISGQEYQVLWVVLRKTWGWQKKEDAIAISQIVQMTELDRKSVCRALKSLVHRKILTRGNNATREVKVYRFNKDFDQWTGSGKTAYSGKNATSS